MKKTQMKRKTLLISIVALLTIISYFTIIGIQNYDLEEPEFKALADNDADGVINSIDNCPDTPNPLQINFDKDSTGDLCDSDDDNDEIIDAIDAFDKNPDEWADFDLDGIGAKEDTDDDNDGILDVEDTTPVLVTRELTEKYLSEIEDCALADPGTPRLLCFSQFFGNLVEQEENNVIILELALTLTKIGTIDDCHFISHSIGHSALQTNLDLYENLIGVDGAICRGGFYHGIMSEYFTELKENGSDITGYKTLCNKLIGTPDYKKCVHGIGHGLIFYFDENLNSVIDACDQMSLYQGSMCMGGAMMQYTDNKLTESKSLEEDISEICSKSELRPFDYQECNDKLGLSLAFHTNHDFEVASKFCDMIKDEEGRKFCFRGLEREISDAKAYKEYDPTEGVREMVQPFWIKEDSSKWIVDFRSPALISGFVYDEQTKMMQFSFDKPYRIIMYVSTDLLPEDPTVTVNGQVPKDLTIEHGLLFDHTMLEIVPEESGTVLITSN